MDFRKVTTDTLVSSGRLFVGTLSGIIIIPVITKLMGADKYGIYITIFALVSVFTTTGGLHLKGALIRYTSKEEIRDQALYDTLALSVGSAVVFTGIFFTLHYTIGVLPVNDADLAKEALIVGTGIYILLSILSSILVNYPRAKHQVKRTELILLVKQLLESLVLIPVLYFRRDLAIAIWSIVFVALLLNVGLLVIVLPRPTVRPKISRFGKYLRYSLPMVPKALSARILTHADKYLILYFLSPTATGIYSVAYGVTTMLQTLSSPLNSTLYPTVSSAWDNQESEELRRLYASIIKGYSLIGIPAVVGLTLLSGPVLRFISTPEVAEEGQILVPLLAVGFLFRGYENFCTYILKAAEETWKIGSIIVIAMVMNLCLNVVLIPTAGIVGAAIATLLSHILIASYILYHALEHLELSLPYLTIGKSFVASGLMAIGLLVLPFPYGMVGKLVVYPVVGVFVYAVTMVLIGGLTRSDRETIRRFVFE